MHIYRAQSQNRRECENQTEEIAVLQNGQGIEGAVEYLGSIGESPNLVVHAILSFPTFDFHLFSVACRYWQVMPKSSGVCFCGIAITYLPGH